MSTTSIKIFPDQPYWDTFDETKNYHRVLFRPGYAVQARELTQMQTALQAQIDRHGQYAFKDGSRVVNGEVVRKAMYTDSNLCYFSFLPDKFETFLTFAL